MQMKLATKFLTTLEPDFEPDDITKAFGETNRLFLSQKNSSDEDIFDLLDVCQEFSPQIFLSFNKEYEQLWNRLAAAALQKIQDRRHLH